MTHKKSPASLNSLGPIVTKAGLARPLAPRQTNCYACAMETLREIWAFLRVRKKFWLAPIIIALMLLGALLMLAPQAGVLSPFLYAL
jgi:hypothetical protein